MSARRTLHDEYFNRAKAEGYLARSAYKLTEINDRKKLLKTGDRVLDLGCAPGSWLQVAAKAVGARGMVVGVDLQAVERGTLGHTAAPVTTIVADIFALADDEMVAPIGGGQFDVVLSDMAPNTTGFGDDFRSVALCRRVLELANRVLRPGGHLAMKVFEGEEYSALLREAAGAFADVKGFKPKASREVSREMYIIAKSKRGAPGRVSVDRQSTGADSQEPRTGGARA